MTNYFSKLIEKSYFRTQVLNFVPHFGSNVIIIMIIITIMIHIMTLD